MPSHPTLSTLRILWFALLAATFMYMGIAYGVLAKNHIVPQVPQMPIMFAGLSVMIAATSFFLPRMIYNQAAKATTAETTEEAIATAFPARYREAMPKRIVFADPEAATKIAFMCFMSPFILSIALSEAIALFGLVLVQLGFDMPVTLPFFLAGALLVAIRFPRQSAVLSMFEQARGAYFPTPNQ